MTASMTASRVLGPDEPTRDCDSMTLTLKCVDGYWGLSTGHVMFPARSSSVREVFRDPATVVTRPTPPERTWQPGDRVEDGNGQLWHREQSTYSPSGTDVWTDRRCTWRAAFGIPSPLTYLVPAPDGGA